MSFIINRNGGCKRAANSVPFVSADKPLSLRSLQEMAVFFF